MPERSQPRARWVAPASRRCSYVFLVCGLLLVAAHLLFPVSSAAATTSQAKPQSSAKSPTKKAKRPSRPRPQRAPTAERIREIQTALASRGFGTGEPTGKLDAATLEALKRFQESKGFPATGKLDARTLQALGLGSEVAGKAPPRAVAQSNGTPQTPHR